MVYDGRWPATHSPKNNPGAEAVFPCRQKNFRSRTNPFCAPGSAHRQIEWLVAGNLDATRVAGSAPIQGLMRVEPSHFTRVFSRVPSKSRIAHSTQRTFGPHSYARAKFQPKRLERWKRPSGVVGRCASVAYVAAARLLGLIYQRQLITIKLLGESNTQRTGSTGVECAILASVAGLQELAHEFPSGFRDSVDDLVQMISRGRVVTVARCRRADGAGSQVVGYEISELGVFSALKRRIQFERDVVFSHWAEVAPSFRGRRVHGALFAARDAYYRNLGGLLICGVCRPYNRASLKALLRDGAEVVGIVECIALFGFLRLWHTPATVIRELLAQARQQDRELRIDTSQDPATPKVQECRHDTRL